MQPVLALAPLAAPVPEAVVEMPPLADVAFLASLEAEAAVPDLTAALPAIAAVVPVPAIVVPDPASAAKEGEGITPRPPENVETDQGRPAPAIATVEAGKTGDRAERPTDDVRPEDVSGKTSHAARPVPETRPAEGGEGMPGNAKGFAVSDDVRPAVPKRGAAQGSRADDAVLQAPANRMGSESRPIDAAPDRGSDQAPGPPFQAELATPDFGNPQMVTPRAGEGLSTSGKDVPQVVSAPNASAATRGGDQLQRDAAAAPPDRTPATPHPGAEAIPDSQPRVIAVRPGMWESIFTSLSLPLPADAGLSAAFRPKLVPLGDGLHFGKAAHGPDLSTEAVPIPVAGTQGAERTAANDTPKVGVVKALAALPAPALAMPMLTHPSAPGKEMADEASGAPLAPGSGVPGGIHIPAGPGGPQSSPVPQAVAQITAALTRSADGATELALSPEELGHVRLRLEPDSANPDRMVVMITFERAETLDLFRRHAGELAEALRAAGYAGADIGFGQDHTGSHGNEGQGGAAHRSREPPDAIAPPSPSSPPRRAAGASLDLRL